MAKGQETKNEELVDYSAKINELYELAMKKGWKTGQFLDLCAGYDIRSTRMDGRTHFEDVTLERLKKVEDAIKENKPLEKGLFAPDWPDEKLAKIGVNPNDFEADRLLFGIKKYAEKHNIYNKMQMLHGPIANGRDRMSDKVLSELFDKLEHIVENPEQMNILDELQSAVDQGKQKDAEEEKRKEVETKVFGEPVDEIPFDDSPVKQLAEASTDSLMNKIDEVVNAGGDLVNASVEIVNDDGSPVNIEGLDDLFEVETAAPPEVANAFFAAVRFGEEPAVWGLGKTSEEAIDDASAQLLGCESMAVDWQTYSSRSLGECVVYDCTKQLYDSVNDLGGDVAFEWRGCGPDYKFGLPCDETYCDASVNSHSVLFLDIVGTDEEGRALRNKDLKQAEKELDELIGASPVMMTPALIAEVCDVEDCNNTAEYYLGAEKLRSCEGCLKHEKFKKLKKKVKIADAQAEARAKIEEKEAAERAKEEAAKKLVEKFAALPVVNEFTKKEKTLGGVLMSLLLKKTELDARERTLKADQHNLKTDIAKIKASYSLSVLSILDENLPLNADGSFYRKFISLGFCRLKAKQTGGIKLVDKGALLEFGRALPKDEQELLGFYTPEPTYDLDTIKELVAQGVIDLPPGLEKTEVMEIGDWDIEIPD